MNKLYTEQITVGLQKLYAVVPLIGSYHDLCDLQREITLLQLTIDHEKIKLRDQAFKEKSKREND